jgi:hypothetical protein
VSYRIGFLFENFLIIPKQFFTTEIIIRRKRYIGNKLKMKQTDLQFLNEDRKKEKMM